MGLFDIFKRRSKKAKEQKEREAEQQKSLANAEDKVQHDDSSATSETDRSAGSAQVASDNEESTSSYVKSSSSRTTSVQSETSASAEGSNIHDSSETSDSSSKIEQPSEVSSEATVTSVADSSSSSSKSERLSSDAETSPSSHPIVSEHSDTETSAESSNESARSASATGESNYASDESASDHQALESEEPQTDNDHEENQEDAETEKFEHGLAKSRSSFGQRLNALFANFRSVDDDFFDDLEDTLIESDVGFDMAIKLTDQLREEVKLKNVKKAKEVQNVVIQKLIELYDEDGNGDVKIHFADQGPTVILFVGVNGVGKTTTIGKMANQYHQEGKKVLLAAADTFRAGAIQQLDVWAQRAHVDIVKKAAGSDPAAVVYEAVHKAKDEDYDILFVDTAGRLQNKVNLMNELAKMKKVITREIPDAPQEILLVLDATTGQNALSQAKLFKETTDVTGIVLTKLDGSARGGIILAIRSELHIPVKLVGLGEKINDLRPFNANDYVYGLFKGLID